MFSVGFVPASPLCVRVVLMALQPCEASKGTFEQHLLLSTYMPSQPLGWRKFVLLLTCRYTTLAWSLHMIGALCL
jgi:hypothetical protein